MVAGKALSSRERRQIIHHFLILESSPQNVHDQLFFGMEEEVTLKHLVELQRFIVNANVQALCDYAEGPRNSAGRKRKYDQIDDEALRAFQKEHKGMKLSILHKEFEKYWQKTPVSRSVFRESTSRLKIKRKVATRETALVKPLDQADYYRKLEHIDPKYLADIDATPSSGHLLVPRYAYSEGSTRAVVPTFHLNGKMYSVMAIYTPRGFADWEVIEGTITSTEVVRFFNDQVKRLYEDIPQTVSLLDNASVHHTDEAFKAIDKVTDGQFQYSPCYGHRDKPVERGFSLVKTRVYDDVERASRDPVGAIIESLEYYSIRSPAGMAAFNHFRAFWCNHENYLKRLKRR